MFNWNKKGTKEGADYKNGNLPLKFRMSCFQKVFGYLSKIAEPQYSIQVIAEIYFR